MKQKSIGIAVILAALILLSVSSFAWISGTEVRHNWTVPQINENNPPVVFDGHVDLDGEWYGALDVVLDFSEDGYNEELTIWSSDLWGAGTGYSSFEEMDDYWKCTFHNLFMYDAYGLYWCTYTDDCKAYAGNGARNPDYQNFWINGTLGIYDGIRPHNNQNMWLASDDPDARNNGVGYSWLNVAVSETELQCWAEDSGIAVDNNLGAAWVSQVKCGSYCDGDDVNGDGYYEWAIEFYMPWSMFYAPVFAFADGWINNYELTGEPGQAFQCGIINRIRCTFDPDQPYVQYTDTNSWASFDIYTLGTEKVADAPAGRDHQHQYINILSNAYLSSAATCKEPAVYFKCCSDCGAISSETFTYGEPDPSNHVGGTYIAGEKAATCAEEGYSGDVCCSGCKAVISTGHVIEKTEHTPSTAWTSDGTYHWKVCTVCGHVLEKVAHSGGTATCTGKAVCSVCNSKYGSFDTNNHGDTVVRNQKDATCSANGYTGDVCCADCGALISAGKEISVKDHTASDWKYDNAQHWKICTVCGEEISGTRTGHTESDWIVSGDTKYIECTECGKVLKTEDNRTDAVYETVYMIVEGQYSVLYKDGNAGARSTGIDVNEEFRFRSDADFSKFTGVSVDGKTVDPADYDVSEGSTVVVLKKEYVKTLRAGAHSLTIHSTDGDASTVFTVEEHVSSPDTSDAGVAVTLAMMLLSSLGVFAVLKKHK